MIADIQLNRRQLLKWSTPVITAVALPAHAVTSGQICSGPPILNVLAPPKCSGNPAVGTAVIEIIAPEDCPMTLKAIEVDTADAKSGLSSLPSFPADITDLNGETITWIGPASDGTSCLPLAAISVTIDYCCDGGPTFSETYDILQLLLDSNP